MTGTNISSLQQFLQQHPALNVAVRNVSNIFGDGRVLLSLETETGDAVTFAMTAGDASSELNS